MTQMSYPWNGTTIGHASRAPYSSDEWSSLWEVLFGAYDAEREGVLASNHASFLGNLEVTNPSGLTLRVAPGLALVDGTLYSNSADVDFAGSGAGTNYIMLRKDWAAQTVRLRATVNIAPTQFEGGTWDIPLAIAVGAGGAITSITDERRFLNNTPNLYKIQGGVGGSWGDGGLASYHQDAFGGEIQMGVTTITFQVGEFHAETNITFPKPYYSSNAPIVITNMVAISGWGSTANNGYVVETSSITPQGATIRVVRRLWTDGANTVTISWMALGSRFRSRASY